MSALLNYDLELFSTPKALLCILGLTYCAWRYREVKRSPLNTMPTIGYSGVLTSYITAFKWMVNAADLAQKGYDKYPGKAFKVATISKWVVVLSGKQHLEDIRKTPEDIVSFRKAIAEITQSKYTLGPHFENDPYHVLAIQSPLTRNLAYRFEDIHDEIVESFKEYIPETEDWTPVAAYEVMMHIMCRTSNRYFVGLPFCRDPGYLSLNKKFAQNVIISAVIINRFPDFLKPLVGHYLTPVSSAAKRAFDYLGPTIEHRLAQDNQHGPDWAERPNDLITWLLDNTTQEYHRTVRDLLLRILAVNLASIHTSSTTLTHVLYDLAVHPEYVADMRREAETAITEDGWTKSAVQKMRKIDSFLKESQRLNSLGSLAMSRKTLKDWTLSDGTLVPAGTTILIASEAMNKEEATFQDAHTFQGFRFTELCDGAGGVDAAKHQATFVGTDQITFGYGRHACPGRFFAMSAIKAILAHILLNYDVQLEGGSMDRPANRHFGSSMTPNMNAKVMFRKRRT